VKVPSPLNVNFPCAGPLNKAAVRGSPSASESFDKALSAAITSGVSSSML
jgi:hypothetical protein